MRHRYTFFIAILVAIPTSAQQDANPTVIEELIINANPCASASADLMGVKIGVDQLRSVSVKRASFVIEDNVMNSSVTGSLACESSATAAAQGFVSAAIDAQVAIDLSSCVPGDISVEVSDVMVEIDMPGLAIGMGKFFEEQLPLLIEPALRRSLSGQAVNACQQLKAGR